MTTKIALIIGILMLAFGGVMYAQKKDKKDNSKEKVVFDVSMTCENCQKRIEKNIAFEKGVTDMKVNLSEKTVEIEYKKDKTDVDKLQKAIEKLGYTVSIHDNNNEKQE